MDGHLQLVLVPCPFQGHLTPMLELGTILHSKGFPIVVVHTKFNAPNPSNYPDFIFQPILESLIDYDTSPENLLETVKTINTDSEDPFKRCLTHLIEQHKPHDKVACIIYDNLMSFSEVVARHLKLPSIIFYSSSASTARAYDNIPSLCAEGYIPLQDSMLEDQVPGLHPLRFKDMSLSEMGNLEDIIPMIAKARDTGSSSAFVWNTNNLLEHSSLSQLQQIYQIPIFAIGPLHKLAATSSSSLLREDTSCITWLDKQSPRSVIYVSLGSLASINKTELAEMAWGLAHSCQPFLWVIRPGSVRTSEWNELLPEDFKEAIGERGHIVKWAPQREVLAHTAIGGFWSHCGWNSTLESISEGVPLLCMPCFADQKVNARYVSHEWRIGIHLEQNLKRGEIEKAIRVLMVDKEGEVMRQRANAMKEKVDLCIQNDGVAYNSLNELLILIYSL